MTPDFDPVDHAYALEGRLVPHVTGVLAALRLLDDRWFTEDARQRGHAVHAAIHYHLEGDLKWESLDPRIVKYVEAALRFLDVAKFEPELDDRGQPTVEHRVGHAALLYAGTLDAAGIMFGEPT